MLGPGTYVFITLGRRYIRTESGIVGQAMEHAYDFKTVEAANKKIDEYKAKVHGSLLKKPLGIQVVTITEAGPCAS